MGTDFSYPFVHSFLFLCQMEFWSFYTILGIIGSLNASGSQEILMEGLTKVANSD